MLQGLIESVSSLLAASRELLGRLQLDLSQDRSPDEGDAPPEHPHDKSRRNAAAPPPTGNSTLPLPSLSR
jgi:hypothetical protein